MTEKTHLQISNELYEAVKSYSSIPFESMNMDLCFQAIEITNELVGIFNKQTLSKSSFLTDLPFEDLEYFYKFRKEIRENRKQRDQENYAREQAADELKSVLNKIVKDDPTNNIKVFLFENT
jgi:hypothetical protein